MSSISEYYDKQIAFEERQNTAVSELTADVAALNTKIEELQNTPGRITPADQALLDQLQAMSEALTTKLEALDALTPPTAPANTPLVAARAKATTAQAKTAKTKDQAKAASTGNASYQQNDPRSGVQTSNQNPNDPRTSDQTYRQQQGDTRTGKASRQQPGNLSTGGPNRTDGNADLQDGDFNEERDPKTGKVIEKRDPETGKLIRNDAPRTGKSATGLNPYTGEAPAPAWDPDPGNKESGNRLQPIGHDPREGQVVDYTDPKTGEVIPGSTHYVPVRATPPGTESPEEIQARHARPPGYSMRFPKTDNR